MAVWTDIIKVVFVETISAPQLWNTYVMQNVKYLYDLISPRPSGARVFPQPGHMALWPVATPPTGALLCNGQSLLRAGTYADLFAVITTVYGAADGTHFSVPNFTDRSPIGAGNLYSTGSNTGNLTVDASHDHDYDIDHDHPSKTSGSNSTSVNIQDTGSGTDVALDGHTHVVNLDALSDGKTTDSGGSSTLSVLHPVTPIYVIIYY